jgi:tetratricopeptide (TPR) repeat protein
MKYRRNRSADKPIRALFYPVVPLALAVLLVAACSGSHGERHGSRPDTALPQHPAGGADGRAATNLEAFPASGTNRQAGSSVDGDGALLLAQGHERFTAQDWAGAHAAYAAWFQGRGFSAAAELVFYRAAVAAFRLHNMAAFFDWETRLRAWFPLSPGLSELSAFHAEAFEAAGRLPEALVALRARLAGHAVAPGDESALRLRIARLLEKTGPQGELLEEYLAIVRLGFPGQAESAALFALGRHFMRAGDRETAFFHLDRLLERYPNALERETARGLLRSVSWRYLTTANGLGDNSVSTIAFDGDDVWVGCWIGGITRFTRSSGTARHFRAAERGPVSDLIRDIAIGPTRVWVATFEGLSWFDKRNEQWRTVDTVAGLSYQRIKALLLDEDRLWVATLSRGLSVLELKTGKWSTLRRKDGLPDDNVVTLCRTPGSVWAGTISGGVVRIDRTSGALTVFRKGPGSLPSNNVKSIAFDGTRVWFGTHGAGVASCDQSGREWRYHTTKNSGLSSDYVYSLAVAPSGEIWMGTLEGGVSIYESRRNAFSRLGVADGLPANDITEIEFEGRYVWFGTLNGGAATLMTKGENDGSTKITRP